MPVRRPVVQSVLVLLACIACSPSDAERTNTAATADSAAIVADAARATATADSVARESRLSRLRTLQPTVDDLAARDSLDVRVEVDLAARRVRVLDAFSDTLAQHDIAIGSKEWPTRTGEWTISQVVLNPEWIPPTQESWAKEEKGSQPGDPDNPLGHAQLVYDLPRSIHGTNAPASIGKAVSHGSIRARNESVLALAELLLQRTGVQRADSIVQEAQRDRTTKRVIDLPQLVPIRVF
jgi:lipoprotein-anchoring transpeptidase ErfK/SrfK